MSKNIIYLVVDNYNYERPTQALSCDNRPPRTAFPDLPVLPALPLVVNPDGWLKHVDGQHFVRKVHHNATVLIDRTQYYVGKKLVGKGVTFKVEAGSGQFAIYHQQKLIKRIEMKGLHHTELAFDDYLTLMQN